MEAAALSLLLYLVMNSLESGETGAEISLSPERLQFFKYGTFDVSCEEEEEEERTQWRVMKRATDGEVSSCPSPCRVSPAFPSTDTGVYWCETGPGSINITTNNSNISTVNVTITDGAVLLESPVRPVTAGGDVTLRCRNKRETSVAADFYKDGVFIGSGAARGMTIRNVSRADEGLYRCSVSGGAEGSPDSWMKVKAPPGGQEEPAAALMSTAGVLLHLVVATPYLLSTVVLGLIYRDRRRELQADQTRRQPDDVIMQIAI